MMTSRSPDRQHSWQFDGLLRLAGLAALAASGEAIRLLASNHDATPLAFACAAVAFLGATSGWALLLLGHHLFDSVQVSQRWCSQPLARSGTDAHDPRHDLHAVTHKEYDHEFVGSRRP